jgi:competence protein ComEC
MCREAVASSFVSDVAMYSAAPCGFRSFGGQGAARCVAALCRVLVFVGVPQLLLASVCVPGWLGYRGFVLLWCISLCAVANVLSSVHRVLRLRKYCFWAAALVFLLYCQVGEVAWRTETRAGIPLSRIVEIEGTLNADSSVSERGNQVYDLILDGCQGKDGSFASCRGKLSVVGSKLPVHLAGVRLLARGVFAVGEDIRPGELFLADEVMELPPSGFRGAVGASFRRSRFSCIRWISNRLGIQQETSDGNARKDSSYYARLLALMLLLGRCDDPSFPLKELSRTSGCAHVLALSGMHLQFFAGAVSWAGVRLLGRRRGRLLAIAPVLLFLALAGPRPSLVRSAFMFFCAVLPSFIGKESPPAATTYAMAFVLQLFFVPHTIVTAGCLFSYAALGGLLALGGPVGVLCSRFLPRRAAAVWGSTFMAVLWAAPCSSMVFGSWTPVSLALSPIVGAMIGLSMASGALTLCTGCGASWPAVAVEWCSVRLYRCLEALMRWGSEVGGHAQGYAGAQGLAIYAMLLLTGSMAILYAGTVLRRRSIRRHELELRIRFPGGDHRVVG